MKKKCFLVTIILISLCLVVCCKNNKGYTINLEYKELTTSLPQKTGLFNNTIVFPKLDKNYDLTKINQMYNNGQDKEAKYLLNLDDDSFLEFIALVRGKWSDLCGADSDKKIYDTFINQPDQIVNYLMPLSLFYTYESGASYLCNSSEVYKIFSEFYSKKCTISELKSNTNHSIFLMSINSDDMVDSAVIKLVINLKRLNRGNGFKWYLTEIGRVKKNCSEEYFISMLKSEITNLDDKTSIPVKGELGLILGFINQESFESE